MSLVYYVMTWWQHDDVGWQMVCSKMFDTLYTLLLCWCGVLNLPRFYERKNQRYKCTYSLPCTRAMSRWNNHGNFHFHSPAVIHRWMVDYKTFIRSRYVQSFEVDDYCGPCNRLNAFRWLLEDRVLHAFRVHGNREMVQQQEGVGCVNKE